MAMDGIQSAAVAYQGSVSHTESVQTASAVDTAQVNTENSDTAVQEAATEVATDEETLVTSKNQNQALKKAVEELNKRTNTEAIFGIHDETNHVTIKIVDKDTKKIIKEYPPEETLDMIAKVWEMAGILVDEKG